MGIIAVDLNQTRPYSLKRDTTEPKTVFQIGHIDSQLLGHLNSRLVENIDDKSDKTSRTIVHRYRYMRDLVMFGVKGVANFSKADGTATVLDLTEHLVPNVGIRRGLTDASLDMLSYDIVELGEQVEKDVQWTENDAKNSPTP